MPNVRLRSTTTALFFLPFIGLLTLADDIKCFCDRLSCPGPLMCTGKWCLIGISTEGGTGRLEQICGWDERERPIDCAKNWDRWTEVCACDEPLCNTFAYLRSNIDRNAQDEMSLYSSPDGKRQQGQHPGRKGWYQGNNLIILLVVMPLGVGSFAVCVIFLNYHCKMS